MGFLGTNQHKTLTIKDCRNSAKLKKGKCLSIVYTNNRIPMEWECQYGHIWKTPYYSIRDGTWCPKCLKLEHKTPIEFLKKEAEKRGGKCLSKKVMGSLKHLLWECANKHQWHATIANVIHKGTWCAKCVDKTYIKLSIKECADFVKGVGVKLLSTEYKNESTPMDWECSLGHKWTTTWCQMRARIKKNFKACPVCYENSRVRFTIVTLKDCQQLASNKDGKLLTKGYNGSQTKMIWECNKGHQWKAAYNSIKQGSWCPKCRVNKNEEECRTIIERLTGLKFKKARPKWLKTSPKGILELDGYNSYHKIAFEYDGEQHYMPTHRANKNKVAQIKKRDILKDQLCSKQEVTLVRIPYWITNKEKFIGEELMKIGFKIKRNKK